MPHRSPRGPVARLPSLAAAIALLGGSGCTAPPTLDLPPRPPDAAPGSDIAAEIRYLDLELREERIVQEVLRGNVPDWMRSLAPVRMVAEGEVVELRVTPDYLAVGSVEDYFLVPLTPQAAWRIAESLGMALPTPPIVDAIWESAPVRLTPAPIPPSPEMTTVPVFLRHSDSVRVARARNPARLGVLTAGHKKDVVMTEALRSAPGRVAIYGWHGRDGVPIQPLYLGHTDRWVDYSHGIRLVHRRVRASGRSVDLFELFEEAASARPGG